MRLGIIDLGTNSLRFSFWEWPEHGRTSKAQLLHRKKVMLLPGQNVFSKGDIPPKSVKRIVRTLKQFENQAQKLHVEDVVAMATCALREAKNSPQVLKEILSKTNVPLEIISGLREATLIAQGVLRAEPHLTSRKILIDIGGGSTEVSLVDQRKILRSCSLPLGAQRLYQKYPHLMGGHPSELRWETAQALREEIRGVLKKHLKSWSDVQTKMAIGSSGTIRSVGKLIQRRKAAQHSRLAWIRQMSAVQRGALRYQLEDLSQLNTSLFFLSERQLQSLAGIEPERRALLVHGSLLLEEILLFFNLSQISCTEASLRDGVLFEFENAKLQPRRMSLRAVKKKKAKRTKKKSK